MLDIKANNTLGDELKGFVNAVKTGETLINNGLVGAKTVELMVKTRESLESNNTITV